VRGAQALVVIASLGVLLAGCVAQPSPVVDPMPTGTPVTIAPTARPAAQPSVAPSPSAPATGLAALEEAGWFGVTLGVYGDTVFADTTSAEWEDVAARICADPNDTANLWVPGSAHMPGGDEDESIYLAVWAAAANFRCPELVDGAAIAANQETGRLLALGWSLQATSGAVMSYYWDRFGPPPDPVFVPGVDADGGVGTTVMCADGTLSDAGGLQGACSWHGGLANG